MKLDVHSECLVLTPETPQDWAWLEARLGLPTKLDRYSPLDGTPVGKLLVNAETAGYILADGEEPRGEIHFVKRYWLTVER